MSVATPVSTSPNSLYLPQENILEYVAQILKEYHEAKYDQGEQKFLLRQDCNDPSKIIATITFASGNLQEYPYQIIQTEHTASRTGFAIVGPAIKQKATFYSATTFLDFLALQSYRNTLSEYEREVVDFLQRDVCEKIQGLMEHVSRKQAIRLLTHPPFAQTRSLLVRPSFLDPNRFYVAMRFENGEKQQEVREFTFHVKRAKDHEILSIFKITGSTIVASKSRECTFFSSHTFRDYLEGIEKRKNLPVAAQQIAAIADEILSDDPLSAFLDDVNQDEVKELLTSDPDAEEIPWRIRPCFDDPSKFIVARRCKILDQVSITEHTYQVVKSEEKAACLGYKIFGGNKTTGWENFYSPSAFVTFWRCLSRSPVGQGLFKITRNDFLKYMESLFCH